MIRFIEKTLEVNGCDRSIDDFLNWALGENYGKILLENTPIAWNKLHGDKLEIHGNESVDKGIEKMVELYKEENK